MLGDMPPDPRQDPPHATGLLLAAGAGRRMGRPKALVHDPDGTSWLLRSAGALLDGGCAAVLVVLGAAAEEAAALLVDDPRIRTVYADAWADGMGASLRVGLQDLLGVPAPGDNNTPGLAEVAVVSLVDLPDVGAAVVRRVLETATQGAPDATAVLARAAYRGAPGHPVVLGRDHWRAVADGAHGDAGARGYLSTHDVTLVECGDLAGGQDRDTPDPTAG